MTAVTLTIDGRRIEVPAGTTLLHAARAAGADIPTLCYLETFEPAASCSLCLVEVEGRPTLAPSCAVAAADGMVVRTSTPDLRQARQVALELLLSDHAGECVAPCAAKCPALLDIPGFVRGIAAGDSRAAMQVLGERLALPGSLGRICPRLCEESCRRCEHDEPLAIAALHRHAADVDRQASAPYVPPRAGESGRAVAIVGAGPAGLAAAYFLTRQGHRCTLFDAAPEPGGMLRYGIPSYRLPKDALDAEIDIIRRLGAEFRMERRWGTDFSLAELRRDFDAVFLGIGAQSAQSLRCEGEELAMSGLELLALVARGNPPTLGADVVVVGGGNTAMDCARSALRLDAQRVTILYRRTRREMPCLLAEVEAAEAEGVRIELLASPVRVEQGPDHRLVVTAQRMTLGAPDASGRREPVPIPGSEFAIECSTLVAAIGQTVERGLAEREGLRVSGWGIAADERTLATNLPGVFAGGDAVLGADLAVRAVAAGRLAAVSIDQYLRGETPVGEPALRNIALRPVDDLERAAIFRSIETEARTPVRELAVARRRTGFEEIEEGLSEEDARREARRCLSCGCQKACDCRLRRLATEYGADPTRFGGARRRFAQDGSHPDVVYEPGKCIMCDACVRVAARAGEALGLAVVGRGFDVSVAVPFGQPLSAGLREAAIACARACPTGALAVRTQTECRFLEVRKQATPLRGG
jgi:formate dehydrogenase major subunit